MRRAALALALLSLVIVVFGPRVQLRSDAPRARPGPLPATLAELDAKVRTSSVGSGDVVPGTEARIVWREAVTKTATAVVYVHGFSASRQELAPLAERVADALDANLYEARLAGHGRPGEALARATAEDWLRDVREALEIGAALGERVVLLAGSTGASLAAVTAVEDRPELAAIVFISPNFGPQAGASELLLWPWARVWVPWVAGERRTWEAESEAEAEYWTTSYPIEALFPMMASVEAARSLDPSTTETPLLVLYHPEDPVVSPGATRTFFEGWGGRPKQMSAVSGPGDAHVLAGDIKAPARTEDLTHEIVSFVRQAKAAP